jgi:hypothetical protein
LGRRERQDELALSLASGHTQKVLIEKELYPFRDLEYREIGEEESGVMTHELVIFRVVKRNCGSIELRFQRGIERVDLDRGEMKSDPKTRSRPEVR